MTMLVGFHTEGWDHLILRAFLARLLGLAESAIEPDWIEASGRGWDFVLRMVPKALKRFYGKCAQLAVIGIDNDGNVALDRKGLSEDAAHPRHWQHGEEPSEACRYCQLEELLRRTRPQLNYVPCKPGHEWPVLIAVPVEAIDAWLIAARALVKGRPDELRAENQPHGRTQKELFYGRPAATEQGVESIALPLIRIMTGEHLGQLQKYSRSFADFAKQVNEQRESILGSRDCWTEGDRAAER